MKILLEGLDSRFEYAEERIRKLPVAQLRSSDLRDEEEWRKGPNTCETTVVLLGRRERKAGKMF